MFPGKSPHPGYTTPKIATLETIVFWGGTQTSKFRYTAGATVGGVVLEPTLSDYTVFTLCVHCACTVLTLRLHCRHPAVGRYPLSGKTNSGGVPRIRNSLRNYRNSLLCSGRSHWAQRGAAAFAERRGVLQRSGERHRRSRPLLA